MRKVIAREKLVIMRSGARSGRKPGPTSMEVAFSLRGTFNKYGMFVLVYQQCYFWILLYCTCLQCGITAADIKRKRGTRLNTFRSQTKCARRNANGPAAGGNNCISCGSKAIYVPDPALPARRSAPLKTSAFTDQKKKKDLICPRKLRHRRTAQSSPATTTKKNQGNARRSVEFYWKERHVAELRLLIQEKPTNVSAAPGFSALSPQSSQLFRPLRFLSFTLLSSSCWMFFVRFYALSNDAFFPP